MLLDGSHSQLRSGRGSQIVGPRPACQEDAPITITRACTTHGFLFVCFVAPAGKIICRSKSAPDSPQKVELSSGISCADGCPQGSCYRAQSIKQGERINPHLRRVGSSLTARNRRLSGFNCTIGRVVLAAVQARHALELAKINRHESHRRGSRKMKREAKLYARPFDISFFPACIVFRCPSEYAWEHHA